MNKFNPTAMYVYNFVNNEMHVYVNFHQKVHLNEHE